MMHRYTEVYGSGGFRHARRRHGAVRLSMRVFFPTVSFLSLTHPRLGRVTRDSVRCTSLRRGLTDRDTKRRETKVFDAFHSGETPERSALLFVCAAAPSLAWAPMRAEQQHDDAPRGACFSNGFHSGWRKGVVNTAVAAAVFVAVIFAEEIVEARDAARAAVVRRASSMGGTGRQTRPPMTPSPASLEGAEPRRRRRRGTPGVALQKAPSVAGLSDAGDEETEGSFVRRECSAACVDAGGVCNEILGRCDCPVGRDGSDCALVVPSCRFHEDMLTRPYQPTTCGCMDEWAAYFEASNAHVPGYQKVRACYPTDSAADVYADPEGADKTRGQRLWEGKGRWEREAPPDARTRLFPFGSCPNDCQAGPGATKPWDVGSEGDDVAFTPNATRRAESSKFRTTLGGRLARPGRTPAGGGGMCSCDYDGDEARPGCVDGGAPRCWCHYAWTEGPRGDCGGRAKSLNGLTDRRGGRIEELSALLDDTWPTAWCFNNCSGNGRCMDHFCHCDPSFFGMDCSLTYTAPGGAGWIRGSVPRITHHHEGFGGAGARRDAGHPGRRPLVYVYDMPPRFTVHQVWANRDGMGQDIGRDDGVAFVEAVLRSRHRTADPNEADFFVVPTAGFAGISRAKALRYVRETWPYFDATKDKGANHIWPTITPDYGPLQYLEISAYTSAHTLTLGKETDFPVRGAGEGDGEVDRNRRWRVRLPADAPDHIARFVQLTHQGLEMGVKSHADVWGAFVPGKDVTIPTADEHWKREYCPDETGDASDETFKVEFHPGGSDDTVRAVSETRPDYERRVMVYFAGTVEHEDRYAPLNMRVEIMKHLVGVPGWYVHDMGGGSDRAEREKLGEAGVGVIDMSHANFCLAPQGTSGGWTVREINGIKAGCIPVYVQPRVTTYFEEYVPRDLYQVALPYDTEELIRAIPDLPGRLARVWENKEEVLRLRRQGRCVCQHLTHHSLGLHSREWWNPTSTFFDVDDRPGVFRTLMATLRTRVDPSFKPVADACTM